MGLLTNVVGHGKKDSTGMEVVLVTKKRKVTVRIDENMEKMIEALRKGMEDVTHTEMNESDVVRACINYMYKESTKNAGK